MGSSNSSPPPAACTLCSELADREYASQKHGWEEHDTFLPPVVAELELVRDLKPGSERWLRLLRCPHCATHYLYRTDYEYLAGGSEDEQSLERLSAADAAAWLAGER